MVELKKISLLLLSLFDSIEIYWNWWKNRGEKRGSHAHMLCDACARARSGIFYLCNSDTVRSNWDRNPTPGKRHFITYLETERQIDRQDTTLHLATSNDDTHKATPFKDTHPTQERNVEEKLTNSFLGCISVPRPFVCVSLLVNTPPVDARRESFKRGHLHFSIQLNDAQLRELCEDSR